MLTPPSPRWLQVTPARFVHEEAGYALVAALLADRDPHRVWANFDFEGPEGAYHHVDALVLTGVGLFALQFIDVNGVVEGDATTWRVRAADGRTYVRSNPAAAARATAQALAEVLEAMRSDLGKTPVVGLAVAVEELTFTGDADARRHVVSPTGEVNLGTALREHRYPGASGDRPTGVTAKLAAALTDAFQDGLEARLVLRADHYRRAGDWRLGDLLFSGATFQDFRAQHVADARRTCRVRRFNVAASADDEKKRKIERGARREWGLLACLEHPGVARVLDFRATELGPCLFFEDAPAAVRLDRFLADCEASGLAPYGPRIATLSYDQRVDLFEQLVEAVRYMHSKGVVHRALSPHSILVLDPAADPLRLQVFSWQTGDRAEATSRGTQHVQQLLEAEAQGFIAPEVARGLPADEAADVFSLGVLACALFAGRAPTSHVELHERLRCDGGLRLSAFANAMPVALERVILEATQAEVGKRIQNVEDLAEKMAGAYATPSSGTEPAEAAGSADADEIEDPTRARAGARLGPYTVERPLGTGGSAVALLAKDADGRQVVLKVPRTTDDYARLREEGAALGRFDHPNIVKCHGVTELCGRPVLIIDYAGKETLRDRLRQEVLGEELLQNLGDDLLGALEHVIDRGELHRDLKPTNLSLRTAGRPERLRLLMYDFSLAGVPRDQTQVGTAAYRDPFLGPPAGRRTWDTAAEMYAAALVLHEMAAGSLPAWGDGRSAPDFVVDAHPHIDPERFDPGVREGLATFFRRALQRDPAQRYPDVHRMRRAWEEAFADAASGQSEHPSQAPVNIDTPVGHLGLSTRALNVLDRLGLPTVADLLRVSESTLRFQPGVGAQTRNELLEARADLAHLRDAAKKAQGAQPAVETPVKLLEHFIDFVQRGRETAAATRRLYLGLDPIRPDQPPGEWPTAAEVADHQKVTRANVSAHLGKDRDRWREHESVARLRDDVAGLIEEAGGVMTPRQLGEDLRRLWFTDVEGEDARLRTACAVARLAVETEMAMAAPRYVTHRDGNGRVLVAQDDARVVWARELGRTADALAARDPLPHPGQVAEALRAVAKDDGLSTARLLRLAMAFSRTAAISSWQELYTRGMSAERALGLARNAVLTLGPRAQLAPVTPDGLRERVAARYPEAEPLPDRPALDDLVRRAGLPLEWSDADAAYVPEGGTRGLLSGTASTRYSSTAYSVRPPEPVATAAPEDPEVRGFEERLRDSVEPGAWCVFTVETRSLLPALAALRQRFEPLVVSLDALLLRHLQEVAKARGVKWALLLHADAQPPTSSHGQRLRVVVDEALARAIAEVVALDAGDRPLLLHEAGLLAHFDRLGAIDRIRTAVNSGQMRARCAWVLIPNDEHRPVLDHRVVPVVTATQISRVPRAWVAAQPAA